MSITRAPFGTRNSLNSRLVQAKETNLMEIARSEREPLRPSGGNLRGAASIQKRPRNSWDLFRERWHVQASTLQDAIYVEKRGTTIRGVGERDGFFDDLFHARLFGLLELCPFETRLRVDRSWIGATRGCCRLLQLVERGNERDAY